MADTRTIDLTGQNEVIYFKTLPSNPPTPPSWYGGVPLFGYGSNPNFAEHLEHTPLSATFVSPFTSGPAHNSYFSRVMATNTIVRGRVGTRDWGDLKTIPPLEVLKHYFTSRNPVGNKGFFKLDMGFCLYHMLEHNNLDAIDSTASQNPHVLQLDLATEGKTLTKQDFRLKISPLAYSYTTNTTFSPCIGGFSIHEAYTPALTDANAYIKVAPRVVVLYSNFYPAHGTPNLPNNTAQYTFTTDVNRQLEGAVGSDYQWINFMDTSLSYGNTATLKKTLYSPNANSRQCLLFVGTFSLKELHDYITDTNKFAIIKTMEDQVGSYGEFWRQDFLDLLSRPDLTKYKATGTLTPAYTPSSFYKVVGDLKPPFFVSNGKVDKAPYPSTLGLYSPQYYGLGKIEAHTCNGSTPIGYKDVFLVERDTAQVIRTTVSDSTGRYVFHGVPTGVELVALSVDKTKTLASVAEDFGVIEE